MKRLTKSNPSGSASFIMDGETIPTIMTTDIHMQVVLDRLAAYEDTGLEPEEIKEHEEAYIEIMTRTYGPLHQKIGKWLQAEKDGRLVVLPCNVGDTVYEANKRGFVSTYKVISVHISDCSVLVGWELIDGIYSSLNGFEVSALGKTVFLTRAEAEAALKKEEKSQ